jgi:hypothetical protein
VSRHESDVVTHEARLSFIHRWTSERLALVSGLIVLGIGCFQLSLPNVLTGVLSWNLGYDDGVYLGASVRFVNGVLPYRDFVFVQPPGILYLMSPIALLGRAIGTHDALILARCVTVIVVACNAVLAGFLMRHQGRVAVVVASLACALWPTTVSVDRTLELEPYLVFFCLVGALLAFGSLESSPRRLLMAGVAFGFAGSVKVWAIFPIVAALLCLLPNWRRLMALAIGAVIGGVSACVPFLVAAPNGFFHDVIVAQLGRQVPWNATATPFGQRLLYLSGLSGFQSLHATTTLAGALFVVIAVLAAIVISRHRRTFTRIEWFALTACVAAIASTFGTAVLYDHYSYFPAVFLALLLAVCASRIAADIRSILRRLKDRPRLRRRLAPTALAMIAALGILGWVVEQESAYGARYLSEASNPAQAIDSAIPPGACVISDYPSDLLVANRFTPSHSGCPAIVDPFGMNLVYDNGSPPHPSPPFSPTFEALWLKDLKAASYVDLRIPFSDFFAWSPASFGWFDDNYTLILVTRVTFPSAIFDSTKASYIYERVRT